MFAREDEDQGSGNLTLNHSGGRSFHPPSIRPQLSVEDGFVCRTAAEFVEYLVRIRNNPGELETLRSGALRQAESASWDSVFEAVYRAYEVALKPPTSVNARVDLKTPLGAEIQS